MKRPDWKRFISQRSGTLWQKMDMDMAFDDFGVGQTRLVALSNTPPDYLK